MLERVLCRRGMGSCVYVHVVVARNTAAVQNIMKGLETDITDDFLRSYTIHHTVDRVRPVYETCRYPVYPQDVERFRDVW